MAQHCDTCGKKYDSIDDLVAHIEIGHNPTELYGFNCKICRKTHVSLELLLVHIETRHNPGVPGKIFYYCFCS